MSASRSPKRRHGAKAAAAARAPTGKRCAASGKIRYPRRAMAAQALHRAAKHYGHGHLTGVYKCPHCRDFHMTSKPQRPAKIEA